MTQFSMIAATTDDFLFNSPRTATHTFVLKVTGFTVDGKAINVPGLTLFKQLHHSARGGHDFGERRDIEDRVRGHGLFRRFQSAVTVSLPVNHLSVMPHEENRAGDLVFANRLVDRGVEIGGAAESLRGGGGAQNHSKREQLHIPRLSGSRQNGNADGLVAGVFSPPAAKPAAERRTRPRIGSAGDVVAGVFPPSAAKPAAERRTRPQTGSAGDLSPVYFRPPRPSLTAARRTGREPVAPAILRVHPLGETKE